jgi:tetratricopeptide (TPR) repeat protein
MKKIIRLLVPALLCAVVPLQAQWNLINQDGDSVLRAGVQHIYNLEFDAAHTDFNTVLKMYPEHPAGYFLDAMVEWWRVVTLRHSTQYDQGFLDRIESVVSVCDKQLDKDGSDIVALFFKGGALGYRARFYAMRESMLKAANDGLAAVNIMNECKKIAPGNHDIMLGTGIYSYYAAVMPEKYPMLKPIMVMFPGGDAHMGKAYLDAAARLGRYANVEAEVQLMQIYLDWEQNAGEAIHYARSLHERYPKNPMFQRYLGRCYYSLGVRDSLELTFRDVLNRYVAKQAGYDHSSAREALYYIGWARMQDSDLDMALKYFYKCDEASRSLDQDPSGFMVRTNLNLGYIYDLQGKRDLAIKQYNKVMSWEDRNGSHAQAQRYLQTPYGR